jgi:hypothetical protein
MRECEANFPGRENTAAAGGNQATNEIARISAESRTAWN